MLSHGLRALPVLADDRRLLCLVGESELTGLYLRRATAAERDGASLHNP
jgi:CBS-domain-containing membrane protein